MGYRRNAIEIDGDPMNGYRRNLLSPEISKLITANGFYRAYDDNARGYKDVDVHVPNTYTQDDEGKVLSNGILVPQTSRIITANGVYDTTLNNQVTANVPNTYTQADEGKVVHGSELVAQTPLTVTKNGVYDTELHNPTTVAVPDFEIAEWGLSEPATITIITPPTKTDYFVGDTIDYSGLVVGLLDENGDPYISADYPDSLVPFDELVFPVSVAPRDNFGFARSDFEDLAEYMPISFGQSISGQVRYRGGSVWNDFTHTFNDDVRAFGINQNDDGASSGDFSTNYFLYEVEASSNPDFTEYVHSAYTYNNQTAYWFSHYYMMDHRYVSPCIRKRANSVSDNFKAKAAWTVIFGSIFYEVSVPVRFGEFVATITLIINEHAIS